MDQTDRTEALIDALDEVDESGENMIGVRDDTMKALFGVLEDEPELRGRLAGKLDEALDRDVDEIDESAATRLLLRAGLAAVDSRLYEDLRDAVGERARRRA